jgi:alpha-beta hydrolase superfamily lysophospholipase
MTQAAPGIRDYEWSQYYEQFTYFSAATVRDHCHPRIMEHDGETKKAIVLVHGLTDSPYFMTAIAAHFYQQHGYNVYLPLLHFHGLKEPRGMEGVKLEEWKANVNFAVDRAASKAGEVSIGGLSTGGALSFYTAVHHPKITGTLYLFSAALDLAGGPGGLLGEVKERLLRLPMLVDVLDKNEPLIGDNPYRYVRMDVDGARELSALIEETDQLIKQFRKTPFVKRVFAAHSESDITADITGIEALQAVSDPNQFTFYRIGRASDVSHASLVLRDPVYATGVCAPAEPLEKANPLFQAMMAAVSTVA